MRILFWGTPAFAVPSLRALLGEGHEVVGVVTRPDRPVGRGQKLTPPPVKVVAEEDGIAVLQPDRPVGEEFERVVRALDPELSVVVAYGQILKREILDMPSGGSINVHASLLPELRGAAPIHWAIIRGHAETGVTIMRMAEELDAGPILYQVREPIGPDEIATELSLRLSELGAEALVEALALIEGEAIDEVEQDHARATYAPRLTPDDARIDWTRDAAALAARIRGLDDSPGAWTTLNGERVNLYRPTVSSIERGEPGQIRRVDPGEEGGIVVSCGTAELVIGEVKPAGKRRMSAAEWVRGAGPRVGDRFV
ncbi:MAG TPA: methionyl-tRNA formyltransferase [Longimicrobiales bacterium]|nr:methionyl-tRNA formyltransferase [Longimicrobiales bacterium]